MNFIKNLLEKVLNSFDNGRFLREPVKLFYFLNGICPFVLPLICLYQVIEYNVINEYTFKSWWGFTLLIAVLAGIAWLTVLAYCAFVFWKNRIKDLDLNVRTGDSTTAMPIMAHYIKCWGESTGLILAIAPVGMYVIGFVFMFLNGFAPYGFGFSFDQFLLKTIYGIAGFFGLLLVEFIICYPIIFVAHYISENIRIKAQIANDLRDVSDIHRAATMTPADDNK